MIYKIYVTQMIADEKKQISTNEIRQLGDWGIGIWILGY